MTFPRPAQDMFTSCIFLAAGTSSRMNADKLALDYQGDTVFDRALSPFTRSPFVNEIIVVVNPDFCLALEHKKCRAVVNSEYREGMGSSIRIGVAAASHTADTLLVALADMPEMSEVIIAEVIEAFHKSAKPILVPTHAERTGHPVVFAGLIKDELLKLEGDVGARMLIRDHPELVEYFATKHRGVIFDVDTPEDLGSSQNARDAADAPCKRKS